jgi:hypothetical protein
LTLTDSAADRFPPDPASTETTDVGGTTAFAGGALAGEDEPRFGAVEEGVTPEEDARSEPSPIEVPDEDALPDEVPVDDDERDPDIEATAVLPVIEPPEEDTETT